MFTNQHMMASSSLAIPSGTLGFVMDQQRLYIRVNLGWQAISVSYSCGINEGPQPTSQRISVLAPCSLMSEIGQVDFMYTTELES